jgi:ribonuclease R
MSTQDTEDPAVPGTPARGERVYEFPIPSREAILAHLTHHGEPLALAPLAEALGLASEREREALARRLRAMERDGQLLRNRRGRYGLAGKMDLICGRVIGHPDGFGFLEPDEGGGDLFLSPRAMRRVLHGDRVMARVTGLDARGRREGAIVEVLERRHQRVVGRYLAENHAGVVLPADRRLSQNILVASGAEGGAGSGQIVVAEILEQPTDRTPPLGRVVEVLGDHLAPGMEIEVAIRMHELPNEWPDEVRDELASLGPEVPEVAKRGREDLRTLPLVTIDGEDARDFDDAVHCERRGRGFRLVVAIADVAHYVRPDSALDREAWRRGNSVYFPGYVIPMLPEILSNGLCSLNPQVDRLCLACEMDIGARGAIERFRFFEAVMRSAARLTYTEVAALLAEPAAAARGPRAALLPALENLHALYRLLQQARERRGAIDFELPETRIVFNAERKIERIASLERNDAHRLIEECMLAANVCAAEQLVHERIAVPFRVHAGPTPEKLDDLRSFLAGLGLDLGGGDEPQASDYARLLARLAGRPDARLIQMVLLRSLSQAIYSPDNIGHFALGYPRYTHFTSPIRRYPDLLVHRALKALLVGRPEDVPVHTQAHGEHLSMTERRADDATRDVIRWLKAEYLLDRVGEEFDGIITGVTGFGLFVELNEIFLDGLVHVTALGNDYYHYDPQRHRLLGERTRASYRLGDAVRVRVLQVDLDEAKVDLEIVAKPQAAARHPRAGARGARRRRRR